MACCGFALVSGIACSRAMARSVVAVLPRGIEAYGTTDAVVAGANVVYVDPWRTNVSDIRIDTDSGDDRLLMRYPEGLVHLAGSTQLLALIPPAQGPEAELLVGAPAGTLSSVSSCAKPSLGTPEGAEGEVGSGFALDASDVAYLDDGCGASGASLRLIVQNMASGGGPAFELPLANGVTASDVSLAGPYVAFHLDSTAGGEIVEYDWRTGAETLRVPDGGSYPCSALGPPNIEVAEFCGLAVQADGKLARLLAHFRYDTGYQPEQEDLCKGTIDWLSPANTIWRTVAADACGPSGRTPAPLLAADRIVYPRDSYGSHAVVDLQGQRRSLGDTGQIFSFDGQRILVHTSECTGETITSDDVLNDPPLQASSSDAYCPVRFSKARLYLGRHPHFAVDLSCPKGCWGPVIIGTSKTYDAHTSEFVIAPGGHRLISLPLTRRSAIVREAKAAAGTRKRVMVLVDTFKAFSYDPNWSPERNANNNNSRTTRQRTRVVRGHG